MKKRNRNNAVQSGSDLIQIMTISLFIILLAFFILLNAIAIEDNDKLSAARNSLQKSFSIFVGGFADIPGEDVINPLNTFDQQESKVDLSSLLSLDDRVSEKILIKATQKGTIISIPSRFLFDWKSFFIKKTGDFILEKLSETIAENNYPIEIIGHTDNMRVDNKMAISNRKLSALRAQSIYARLIKDNKIDPKRFTVYGWGEYKPLNTNRTPEEREQNRRIDFLFVHKKKVLSPSGLMNYLDFLFQKLETEEQNVNEKTSESNTQ